MKTLYDRANLDVTEPHTPHHINIPTQRDVNIGDTLMWHLNNQNLIGPNYELEEWEYDELVLLVEGFKKASVRDYDNVYVWFDKE